MQDKYNNPYEKIISKYQLPNKNKYTKRDVDTLCIASLFDKSLTINNQTISEKEAKFIITSIIQDRYGKDYNKYLSDYYFANML